MKGHKGRTRVESERQEEKKQWIAPKWPVHSPSGPALKSEGGKEKERKKFELVEQIFRTRA